MINEILFMNGYGSYVWSSFIFTLIGFFILYSVVKLQLTKEQKNELIRTYGKNEHDSGSTEVQIALLTARIVYLTEHFKQQPKDFHSRRGLLRLVGRRRNFLNYLKAENVDRYQEIIQKLGIRR